MICGGLPAGGGARPSQNDLRACDRDVFGALNGAARIDVPVGLAGWAVEQAVEQGGVVLLVEAVLLLHELQRLLNDLAVTARVVVAHVVAVEDVDRAALAGADQEVRIRAAGLVDQEHRPG